MAPGLECRLAEPPPEGGPADCTALTATAIRVRVAPVGSRPPKVRRGSGRPDAAGPPAVAVSAACQRRFLLVATGIVLVALALRLHRLGAQDLWLDETLAVDEATATVARWHRALAENTGPVYFLLLRATTLGGIDEARVRALSAVTGALFVAAIIWVGREVFDSRTGLWAGAAAALNPIHVYYSQEARVYALLTLLLTLSAGALWRALATGARRWWAVFVVLATLALYSHLLAALPLAAAAVAMWLWPPSAGGAARGRSLAVVVSAVVALFGPWLLVKLLLANPVPGAHSIDWIRLAWERTPPWLALPKTLEVFAIGSQAGLLPVRLRQLSDLTFPTWLRVPGLVASFGLVALAFGPWRDRGLGIPQLRRKKAWLALLLSGPLLALWLLSFVKPLYVAGRYDLVAFLAWPLIIGLGLAKLQTLPVAWRHLATTVALLVAIPSATKLAMYYRTPAAPSDARTLARVLNERAEDGDVVVFTGSRGVGVLYYLRQLGYHREEGVCVAAGGERRIGCWLLPLEREALPTVLARHRDVRAPEVAREDTAHVLSELRRPGGTLWLVVDEGEVRPESLRLPKTDALLLAELGRRGFRYQVVSASLGLFRFHRE
jgi:4-amino-4-deoxy-L-arabinose transferase-like glycosyltransferase